MYIEGAVYIVIFAIVMWWFCASVQKECDRCDDGVMVWEDRAIIDGGREVGMWVCPRCGNWEEGELYE